MKKIFLFLMFLSSLSLSAQQYEVSGKVVDKKTGTPIEGAEVTSLGVYKAETGYDGTFTLKSLVPLKNVKVTAPGKNYEQKKAVNGMTVKMKPQTVWNAKPEKWSPFVGLEIGIPHYNELSIGIMAGVIKRHGGYVKVLFSPSQSTNGTFSESYHNVADNHVLTGNYKYSASFYGAGYMYRVGAPLNVYVGGGYMVSKMALEKYDGTYMEPGRYSGFPENTKESKGNGPYAEIGAMGVYKHAFMNLGCAVGFHDGGDATAHVQLGIGYKF